jgi:hypothetical protein
MARPVLRSALASALLVAAGTPAFAQSLSLDTNFGAGGTTVMTFPGGWWTDWDDRDAHLINQGGAFSNSWVVAGSHRTLIGPNLFHRRGWGYFSDSLGTGSVGGLASEAGPPLTTGGIVQSGSEVSFIGTGAPTAALDSVDIRRTDLNPFAISSSCSGSFQATFSYGPNQRDEVRGAAPRGNGSFLAVGTTRLADGQSRGLIAAINFNCTRDTGFGSNGAVLLDVNPFLVAPPPRRVRVNAVATYTNGAGQERIVMAGGVRYGLAETSPGACFLAVMTPSGALDASFDGDGLRLFDAQAPFSAGPTFCDFHTVLPINDASGRGFVTIADWRRDNSSESGQHLLRWTESGASLPGFNGANVSSANEHGPSALGRREDGLLVTARNYLVTGQSGQVLVSTNDLFLVNPATGATVAGSGALLPSPEASRQVSQIVAASNNRVYVMGTAGPGRFGHNQIVIARFSDGRRTVTVSTLGSGGTVSSTPAGINGCGGPGGVCSAGFLPGTNLSLTAMPLPNHRFGNWSGGLAGCGTNPLCTLTVSADVSGEAVFVPTTSVNIARVGQGGISSDPPGVVCGLTVGSGCSGSFDRDPGFGNQTRFTATAAAGWRFVDWSGDFAGCGSNPICSFVLNQPGFNATARFEVLSENIFANGFEP